MTSSSGEQPGDEQIQRISSGSGVLHGVRDDSDDDDKDDVPRGKSGEVHQPLPMEGREGARGGRRGLLVSVGGEARGMAIPQPPVGDEVDAMPRRRRPR